uniref:Uncharacterized protein n=1 Tax=Moniliophthora roreri TaxID=221103 RepID=A0A0W0G1T2_MONRR
MSMPLTSLPPPDLAQVAMAAVLLYPHISASNDHGPNMSSQLIPSFSSQPSTPVPGHIRHVAHAQLITPIQPVTPTSHSVSVQCPTSSQPISLSATPDAVGESVSTSGAAKSGKMKMIKIGDGSEIFFCRKDVRDPQCPSFANDLDLLGHMWDDKNEDFDEDKCVLWVGNPEHGIALKYWGDVLKLESPDPDDNCWEVWKKKLYPWGLIGEYYNEVGEKKFWEEFTVDGVRLCQKQIVDILRPRNKAKNAERKAAKKVACNAAI